MVKKYAIGALLIIVLLLIAIVAFQIRYAEISDGKIDSRLSYLEISKIRKAILLTEKRKSQYYKFSVVQILDESCEYNDGKFENAPFKNCQKNDVLVLFFRSFGSEGGESQWYLLRNDNNKWNIIEKTSALFGIS